MKRLSLIVLLFCIHAMSYAGNVGGHEYVDLGLPSGTLWATCNVGATKPEEYGDYYAWGEVESKKNYDWDSYKHNRCYSKLTKYCYDSYYSSNYQVGDLRMMLDSIDDAAYAKWGGVWSMPSAEEMQELIINCKWECSVINGVEGRRVVGPNGRSIFFPAAGFYDNDSNDFTGSYGFYWTSSLSGTNPCCAYYMMFNRSKSAQLDFYGGRHYGGTVRPVISNNQKKDSQTRVSSESIFHIKYTTKNIEVQQLTSSYYVVTPDGHSYVDLGLPSRTLWATCNIGALRPEECGYYYAWGETEPKQYYSEKTYRYTNSEAGLTKYCFMKGKGNDGYTDTRRELEVSDDAASTAWGRNWRMPTKEEVKELCEKCIWESAVYNGVYGQLVVGPNGKSIFIPTAGYYVDGELKYFASTGCYWTKTLYEINPACAYYLDFDQALDNRFHQSIGLDYIGGRGVGYPIRPVFVGDRIPSKKNAVPSQQVQIKSVQSKKPALTK